MPLSVTSPGSDTTPINDCYGSQTATAGTALVRLIPPGLDTARACVGNFGYDCGSTAHTMTMQVTMFTSSASSDAASGQAVINLTSAPTAFDGTIIAANDYISFPYEDGTYGYGKVSSVSGLAITLTANLSKKVLKGSPVWFHGAASDHTDRQFTMKASAVTTFNSGDFRIRAAAAYDKGQPILVYVDNITAAGVWQYLSFYYD